jgi:hypothetical protein
LQVQQVTALDHDLAAVADRRAQVGGDDVVRPHLHVRRGQHAGHLAGAGVDALALSVHPKLDGLLSGGGPSQAARPQSCEHDSVQAKLNYAMHLKNPSRLSWEIEGAG